MSHKVDILLSTYNGQQYLHELLDSIVAQSYTSWQLLIRDDGSTDGTKTIIDKYKCNFQDKIKIVNYPEHNVGVIQSFQILIDNSTAQYIMFCDQDDKWFPNKIELVLEKIIEVENSFHGPVGVYSDLVVVGKNLKVINDSLFKMQNIATHHEQDLYYVTHQNPAAGCTLIFNRLVIDKFLPFGKNVIMHDWWISLCCAMKGQLAHINEPTIFYRQHGHNTVGTEYQTTKHLFYYVYDNCLNLIERCRKVKKYYLQGKDAADKCGVNYSFFIYLIKIFVNKFLYSVLSKMIPHLHRKIWKNIEN